jgi:hypothetical protein
MKMPSLNVQGFVVGLYFVLLLFLYRRLSWTGLLTSLGLGVVVYSLTESYLMAAGVAIIALFVMGTFVPRGMEGFDTRTPAPEIAATIRQMKAAAPPPSGGPLERLKYAPETIVSMGYNKPGFGLGGPLVDGFEDMGKKNKSTPAASDPNAKNEEHDVPLNKKDELPPQFKLGEIPAQVKNGPHIDASSTLMKAIQGLDPDQVKAMTADTQRLIETQKSLMGMLNSMKPMMSDGKQLMDTFNQMFGQQ